MKMGDRDKKFLDMFENVSKNNHENTKQTHTVRGWTSGFVYLIRKTSSYFVYENQDREINISYLGYYI